MIAKNCHSCSYTKALCNISSCFLASHDSVNELEKQEDGNTTQLFPCYKISKIAKLSACKII